ncbi:MULTISPECIES: rhodanese-like domain-containing protein [Cloacibacillus]|jgi:rhodanese-related sulfurtransferase|nr:MULTISPECIES: rhodanese-like domain-containing protein [Cloacibacillus]MCD7953688.1 rhodanese-like domain-containing protein [Synergistaceae bacterium]MCC8059211.1 rhodanese-like domain-containing protein [Cloacibacillus sp.]MCC8183956.1 rhodanese-like domain-containing protein [Cloacibacillus porcorum]MCD8163284.1 rhodanese-like domain-containing protein [Synergistaceae bacterium]MCI5863952.1 rhodanese-like domain-containing protein [Cloacibacillus porcorum]
MKKFASLLTVILAAVVMMGATQAAKAEAAAYPLKKISPQEVAVLLETQRPIAIIDVRSLPDFKAGHIPTAESLPFELMMDAMTHTMIPDVNKVIVVYGANDKMSKEAGQKLCDFGYKNVYYMPTFTEWVGEIVVIGPAK